MTSEIARRKADHIDAVLSGGVGFDRLTTGLEAVRFVHCALPELTLDEVTLSSSLFGRNLAAPFLISSMTGGPARASAINETLAVAAETLGIALGVGSQRIALEDRGSGGLEGGLRRLCPSVPLIGNIGAAQLLTGGPDIARRSVAMIEADGVFIHLNPLQEAVQPGGDTNWRGVLRAIERVARDGVPVAVKEVGFGLSERVVRQLTEAGVGVIDVAGAGGTNWARVEGVRGGEETDEVARAFTDWGVPTATALIMARRAAPAASIIASGGIGDGVEAAKAIRLGADVVGFAGAVLKAATEGPDAVCAFFERRIAQLRVACFCTGSADLAALKRAPLLSAPQGREE